MSAKQEEIVKAQLGPDGQPKPTVIARPPLRLPTVSNVPPPIPSSWDQVASDKGIPRERLAIFHTVYHAVYYEPNESGLRFCRMRDITRGEVNMGPRMQFHVTHGLSFWPRDPKQRDPLEQAWFYFFRQWLFRPSLETLFSRSYQPKWIAPNEFMVSDQWVPLRNAAPVYCGLAGLGTCITKYACTIFCSANGNVSDQVPFLAVTPIDATGSGAQVARQRMGIWWAVPMKTCIPLRMAVLSWPTADSPEPSEMTVLGEDGFAEVLNVNYFLNDNTDPAIKFARIAFGADNPGSTTSAVPLRAPTEERRAAMAPYTLTRYGPPEDEDEGGSGDAPAATAEQPPEEEPAPSEQVDGGEAPAVAPAAAPLQTRVWKITDLYPN